MLAALLCLTLAPQEPTPSAAELRAALEALRDGEPGEPAFEAALPRIGDLIRSGETDLVAGGAYLAGKHGRGECASALLDTFGAWDGLGTTGRRAVLDALIRLDVHLEPGRLPVSRWCDDLTYVLLARDAEQHRNALTSLHDACGREGPVRWAYAVTLARLRDPRLAERLLSEDRWPVRIAVRDPGTDVGVGGGTGRMRVSCGRPAWPPTVKYDLQLPAADEPLPQVVPSRRKESSGSCHYSSPLSMSQQADWRRRLLGELLGERPLELAADLDVEWHGPERFFGAVISHLAVLRRRIAEVALELESRGLLERAVDVAARTRFRISLLDRREDRSSGLPRADLGAGVDWDD